MRTTQTDWEAAKKVLLLMAGPLRPKNPLPSPPLDLNGCWNVGTLEKRFQKKLFFLNGPDLVISLLRVGASGVIIGAEP